MTTNREQMMNDVCKRLGLEHEQTVMFCVMCENTDINDKYIEDVYNTIMISDVFTND